ncbi:NAD(P)-dependent oxidoreductase [Poseidonocella sedimentorum]|uniref:Putative NADH-flavin reductase n=1 Tax=Poseidonocella sedimentorum TaxID=871652 RepID=A0A1I6CY88_9RHOB|nr:NAD(P)H-binding protein [Poseidonocella sedimentorum]SFQ98206.1 Putative NADH-flavin reductase [Poseidonocella sedimentorum]
MTKTILLYGGSGRTGTFVMQKALAAGHSVRALVRNPAAISQTHPQLTLVKGTPENADDVAKAMQGCDVVISTLNNARASDSPFAKLVNRDTLLKDIFDITIAAMREQGLRRIVSLGAAGVNDSYDTAPFVMRMLIKWSNLGQAYRDHEMVEDALAASGLDWTVGRAMMLGKKDGTAPVIESYVVDGANKPKPVMQISRASVAQWLIDALDREDLHGKAPLISQK